MIMNVLEKLTLEQQIKVRNFSDKIEKMPKEKTHELLVMLYAQMILKDTIYQKISK